MGSDVLAFEELRARCDTVKSIREKVVRVSRDFRRRGVDARVAFIRKKLSSISYS